MVANCRLKDQITLFECLEAMCKYDNVIARDSLTHERNSLTSRCTNGPTDKEADKDQGNKKKNLITDLTRSGRNCQLTREKPSSKKENRIIIDEGYKTHQLNLRVSLESNQRTLDKEGPLKRPVDYQSKMLKFKVTHLKQYALLPRMRTENPDGV
jgi:hypothetical protein